MSSISSAGSSNPHVALTPNVQAALNALLKVNAGLLETMVAVSTGQKASNPGLGVLVDLSV